jgi:hypothetical protein
MQEPVTSHKKHSPHRCTGYHRCAVDEVDGQVPSCRGLAGRLRQMQGTMREYYAARTAPEPSVVVVAPVLEPGRASATDCLSAVVVCQSSKWTSSL